MSALLRDQHEHEWGTPPKPPIWLPIAEFVLGAAVVLAALEIAIRF